MFSGLAFVAAGLLCLFVFLTVPTRAAWATPANGAILVGVLLLVGVILVCVRVGVVLDRQRRTITAWRGLLVPIHKTEHPFSQTHFVSIAREERYGGKRSYEVFPVRLEGAGTDAITIHEPLDHDKARYLAEDVARFVHLGIQDRSSGHVVARSAGALDQPLQQRLGRANRSRLLPVQPPKARALFSYGGTRAPTTIEILPTGRNGRWFLQTIFTAGFVALFTELLMDQQHMEIGVRALLVFLFVLGVLLPLLLRTALLRERLVVSPEELVVSRRDIFGTKTTRLTGGEVEEVEVTRAKLGIFRGYATFDGGTGRVAIRSDRGSIEVGAALSNPEEVKWLSDVLVHVLTSGSRDAGGNAPA